MMRVTVSEANEVNCDVRREGKSDAVTHNHLGNTSLTSYRVMVSYSE